MKFTKRALAAVLSAAMMTCAFAGCGDTAASASAASSQAAASNAAATGDKVVKIGVYEPASGDNGAGGKQETLGVQYANKVQPTVEINGETYTVQLDIVDNQSSTDKGPSAAQQLVSDGVSVVLGSYGSAVAIAAGRAQSHVGKLEIDALEQRLIVVLRRSKYRALSHAGDATELDCILREGQVGLGKGAPIPHIHFITGIFASEGHASVIIRPGDLHCIQRKALQHLCEHL